MFSHAITRYALLAVAMVVVCPAFSPSLATADDFRVRNEVFLVGQEEPISSSTTVFRGNEVYDFLDDPAETIVFDRRSKIFVLLDVKKRVRAELTAKQVTTFVDELQDRAAKSTKPLARFWAKPQFEESVDQSGQVVLASRWMTYRLRLTPWKERSIPDSYAQFSDSYARLNTIINPGSRPPAARFLVNAAMARRGATPVEVNLTLLASESPSAEPVKLRSQHKLATKPTQDDLDRIAAAEQQMKTFRRVKFEDYRKQ